MSSSEGRQGGSSELQGQRGRKYYNPRTQDQPLANILLAPRWWFIDFLGSSTHSVTLFDDLCMHNCSSSRSSFTNIQFQFMASPLFISVIFLFVLINLIGGSVAGGVMFLLRCSSAVVERRKHKKREIWATVIITLRLRWESALVVVNFSPFYLKIK